MMTLLGKLLGTCQDLRIFLWVTLKRRSVSAHGLHACIWVRTCRHTNLAGSHACIWVRTCRSTNSAGSHRCTTNIQPAAAPYCCSPKQPHTVCVWGGQAHSLQAGSKLPAHMPAPSCQPGAPDRAGLGGPPPQAAQRPHKLERHPPLSSLPAPALPPLAAPPDCAPASCRSASSGASSQSRKLCSPSMPPPNACTVWLARRRDPHHN
eukprot:365011-Chlamydomonas_euryale.AAC.4